jgi:hypothetical protein
MKTRLETCPPGGSVLCRKYGSNELAVACMALPKRSYEEWLEEQQ